jgi:hypothetical protein
MPQTDGLPSGDSDHGHAPVGTRTAARRATTAVVVEVVLGLAGIYGVGWLFAGRVRLAVILLVLSIAWIALAGGASVATAGVGLCGVVPLNVLFAALSAIALNRALKRV